MDLMIRRQRQYLLLVELTALFIFLAGKLGQTEYLGPIAVAAYSYMALVPIIQPPISEIFTTDEEKRIKMEQLRPVSQLEKILFL